MSIAIIMWKNEEEEKKRASTKNNIKMDFPPKNKIVFVIKTLFVGP